MERESLSTYTHRHLLTNGVSGQKVTSHLRVKHEVFENCVSMSFMNKELVFLHKETESHLLVTCNNMLFFCKDNINIFEGYTLLRLHRTKTFWSLLRCQWTAGSFYFMDDYGALKLKKAENKRNKSVIFFTK